MEKRKLFRWAISIVLSFPLHFGITLNLLTYVRTPTLLIQCIAFLIEVMTIFILTKKYSSWTHRDWSLLTFFYLFTLTYMLLGRFDMGVALTELDPLQWIRSLYWGSTDELIFAFFNVLAFIPMPLLIGHWFRSPIKLILLCFTISFSFEALQYMTHRGVFDIGDIFLYWIGILMGSIIYYILFYESLSD